MKTNTNSPALVNEQGLSKVEQKRVNALRKVTAQVRESYDEMQKAESGLRSAFWSFTQNLRSPVNAKIGKEMVEGRLNAADMTLLLKDMGVIKQRITEFVKLAQLDDKTFDAIYEAGLSKVEALKVARGTLELKDGKIQEPEEEGNSDIQSGENPQPSSLKPTFHKAASDFVSGFHNLLIDHPEMKATDDSVPYEFKGETSDGRRYEFRLFVDSLTHKS